ncbi:MAG: XRE family transcriptional regulator [Deltaproteobacteria bacterium]|nr:XRE family transcriptional regulator [Deltaproteobacteria bacterium]
MASSLALNLNAARKRLRYSRAQLATVSGVSARTISRIEAGHMPGVETIAALSAALKTSLDSLVKDRPMVAMRLRALKSVSKIQRSQRLELVRQTVDELHALLPMLTQRSPIEQHQVTGVEAARAVALQYRDRLVSRREMISDVVQALESFGAFVLLKSIEDRSVFGMSLRFESGAVMIVANTACTTERLRHTLVHEFAHVLFHSANTSHEITDELTEEEDEANAFAGEFLAPGDEVRRIWRAASGGYLERSLVAKAQFGISCAAVMKHMNLGQTAWARLQIEHRNIYGRTMRVVDEPKPLARTLPTAPRIHQAIRDALANNQITAAFITQTLDDDALRYARSDSVELKLSPGPNWLPVCERRGMDLDVEPEDATG